MQSEVVDTFLRNCKQPPELAKYGILGDTNRLSELEKYNVVNCGRLLSVERICATAQIAFRARLCSVALVDHEDLHILGLAGKLSDPERILRDVAVGVVCQLPDNETVLQNGSIDGRPIGTGQPHEPGLKLFAAPVQSENGINLGAFMIGVDAHREINADERGLAECFAANCLQILESQRTQSSFVQRAEISRRQAEKLKAQRQTLISNDKLFGKVSRMARICGWELDSLTGRVLWSGKVQAVFDLPADQDVKTNALLKRLGRENFKLFKKLVNECQSEGVSFEQEFSAKTFSGAHKWFRVTGEAEFDGSDVSKVVGTIQDVSTQK